MRRALLVLSLCAVLAPAHAQTVSPEITSMALPLRLAGRLQRSHEMGCSQSFESSQGGATLTLAVEPDGAARLTLDGEYDTTSGPSPGRYMGGDHDFSHLRELHRSLWSGHATILADAILVTFDHVAASEIRIAGYGTLPLPPPTSEAFTGQLRCHGERVDVLPATPAIGEVAIAMDLLRCAWAGTAPAPFDRYADEVPWALGSGTGVENRADGDAWGSMTTHQVRALP